ncbi:MAG: hypothetical protein FK731_05975 [Asgard group archaeon]|nr:hypothetical protein [Asgard group archaeon]
MKSKKALLTSIAIILSISIVIQSINYANAIPQYDTLIFYLTSDVEKPEVNQIVNITVVFKNYLENNDPLTNVTAEFDDIQGLNVTNVFNVLYEDPSYNKTDLFIHGTNSTPIFFWNNTYIEVAWFEFANGESQMFWFTINITETFAKIENPVITYTLDGEEDTFNGAGLGFDIGEETNMSAIPSPWHPNWQWYCWFIGGLLIAAPLIVIVITRLTLWKR